jgi:hypothetical protein
MKLLPEVPTKELLDAIAYGQPISASHDDIYRAMYAAAPEVKDEPVAWMQVGIGPNEGMTGLFRQSLPKKYNAELTGRTRSGSAPG